MNQTLIVEDGNRQQAGGGTHADDKAAASHQNGGLKEVEYASIDFSALKNRPRGLEMNATAETEYAEVKREKRDTTAASLPVEGDAREEQVEEEVEEEEEAVGLELGEEGKEGEPVYSSVKDAFEEL